MDLSKAKRGYFVGIGGVGVNALAKFVADFGIQISGSDAKINGLCNGLIKNGAKIGKISDFFELENADFLVFSSAIPSDNPEIAKAREKDIPVFERHEFLARVSNLFGQTVAIAGTHGKTTTTAMLAHILKSNNVKFAAMIGGESIEFSNYVNNTGVSQIEDLKDCVFLCEACEYKRNLLALDPRVSVVLNAECDHPDCYDDLKSVKATFSKFLQKSSVKIVCENNLELIDKTKKQNSKNSFCVCVENGKEKRIQCFFKADGAMVSDGKKIVKLKLKDEGEYNYKNATFAIAAGVAFGLNFENCVCALESYQGVKRRFERADDIGKTRVYFDFAHHPSEIAEVIKRARNLGKIMVVFQPHTYSRTKAYLDDFASVLGAKRNGVKTVAIMPTYAARERLSDGVDSDVLFNAIFNKYRKRGIYLLKGAQSTIDFVKSRAKSHDVILMIGAGDIYDLKDMLR